MLEECLLNRVPVNITDRAGNSPLHCAAHSGRLDCLERLLAVPKINVNARNRMGDTPLHLAAWRGHAHCVRAIRKAGGADLKVNRLAELAVKTFTKYVEQVRNDDGKTASEVCQETETKAEFEQWELAAGIRERPRSINHEYEDSSDEDEEEK